MKKAELCIYVFITGFFLISCDSYHKRMGNTDYYVGWLNMPEHTSLSIKVGREIYAGIVDNRVTDVYWNDQYILVTRCDVWSDSIVGYYVVEMLPHKTTGVPYKKEGPLSKEEYELKKEELNLKEDDMKYINIFK